MLLLRLPEEGTTAALDAVRDNDPFWQRGIAQYELLPWIPVIGKERLDSLTVASRTTVRRPRRLERAGLRISRGGPPSP